MLQASSISFFAFSSELYLFGTGTRKNLSAPSKSVWIRSSFDVWKEDRWFGKPSTSGPRDVYFFFFLQCDKVGSQDCVNQLGYKKKRKNKNLQRKKHVLCLQNRMVGWQYTCSCTCVQCFHCLIGSWHLLCALASTQSCAQCVSVRVCICVNSPSEVPGLHWRSHWCPEKKKTHFQFTRNGGITGWINRNFGLSACVWGAITDSHQ